MPASAARLESALRLRPGARVVQHAVLRTATLDEQAPLRFALEDALATADFGDSGRLVLVRRLQLHTLPRHADPQSVARALEQAWRTVVARALPARHPQASEALAVYFTSRFEARLQWLHCVARQLPTCAWFWRAALPELGLSGTALAAPDAADSVAAELWQEASEPARQALLHWTDTELRTLAHTLGPAVLGAWQRRLLAAAPAARTQDAAANPSGFAVRDDTPAAAVNPPAFAARDNTPALQATALRVAAAAPATPAAAAWLAALWLTPALGRAATATQVQQVLAWRHTAQASATVAAASAHSTHVAVPGMAQALTRSNGQPAVAAPLCEPASTPQPDNPKVNTTDTPAQRALPASATEACPTHCVASSLQAAAAPRAAPQSLRQPAPMGLPWLADAKFSTHAGLLLVLNALNALRFDPWLQQQPAALRQPLAYALMARVLDQSGAPPHDPQRAWLAMDTTTLQALSSVHFDEGTRTLDQALRLWRLKLRRALRRRVGLDLVELVQRPGWVSASATHLDVVYALDAADLRLRRHGLDADPGWVPWFGRIVALHFIPRAHLSAPGDEPGHG